MSTESQEIRLLTDSFYEIQNLRIQIGNRIAMLKRDYEINEQNANELHDMVSARMLDTEKEIEKRVRKFVKSVPVYAEWIQPEVKGVSELLAGSLIAGIQDIGRFDTVSKLWKYCGVGINPDGDIQKRKRGERINYNPFLKTTCWKIGESFVKISDRGFYGEMLRLYKDREVSKLTKQNVTIMESGKADNLKELKLRQEGKWTFPEGCRDIAAKKLLRTVDLGDTISQGQVHARAKRKAVKLFLSHLWTVWREIEGLPVLAPYINANDPTHHYYPPPGWKTDKAKVA